MGIIDKIEEIRNKPEHVRLRYVWFFVAISMIFVLMIWFFSMKTQISATKEEINKPLDSLGGVMTQFDSQKNSLKDAVDNSKEAITQNLSDSIQE